MNQTESTASRTIEPDGVQATPSRLVALEPAMRGRRWHTLTGDGEVSTVLKVDLEEALRLAEGPSVFTANAADTIDKLGDLYDRLPGLCCLETMLHILANGDPDRRDFEFYWKQRLGSSLPRPVVSAFPETYQRLRSDLEQADLLQVFELEHQIIPVAYRMRENGIGVDSDKLERLVTRCRTERTDARSELRHLLGRRLLNPDNPVEIESAFRRLGIPLDSTKRTTMDKIHHPAAQVLIRYRRNNKLLQDAESCLACCANDGRMHPRWKPLGTTSGRFSCHDPAFLSLVKHPDLRACFIPRPGNILISADYSGAELRPLAYAAQDPQMIAALNPGRDFHRATVAAIRGISEANVSAEARGIAKEVFFGTGYGMGNEKLAEKIMELSGNWVDTDHAGQWKEAILGQYPGFRRLVDAYKEQARSTNVARTLSLRRRVMFPDGQGHGGTHLSHVAQGTIADAMKFAMLRLQTELVTYGAYLVANRHDELIVEAPVSTLTPVSRLIREVMQESLEEMTPIVSARVKVRSGITMAEF